MHISALQELCWQTAEDKGFHDDRPDEGGPALVNWQANKLLLMVSEVIEAHDELRKGKLTVQTYYPTHKHSESLQPRKGIDKPEGVPSELADVVIRVLDFCGTEGIDLEAMIEEKLRFNASRERLHGKKF